VGGDFYCGKNELTSLKGAPKEVGGRFHDFQSILIGIMSSENFAGF